MANTTWAAPEILRGGAVTKEGDVFTFAMVAIEVCTRDVFDKGFSTYFPRTDFHGTCPLLHELPNRFV